MNSTDTTCNNSSLDVYVPTADNPWNIQKINHLYRRATFGATPEMLAYALEKTPIEIVDEMIIQAQNAIPTDAPVWGEWSVSEFGANNRNRNATRLAWNRQMTWDLVINAGGLNDRLTLFWSNHLVASYLDSRAPPLFYRYYNLLQRNASGNFKEFVHEAGLSGAMLRFLNGVSNKAGNPNENYARELLELFTLGVDNGYTQEDIEEIARALTGWTSSTDAFHDVTFNPDQFDTESKTFFGRTGEWGYDDVINILFEEREVDIAEYICEVIYQHFVSPAVTETIVKELAITFINNDFDILPVMAQLLKSQHFYDVAASSVIIKSPIDLEISLKREMNLQFRNNYNFGRQIADGSLRLQGQALLEQISVEGWPEDRTWVNTNFLIHKWDQLNIRLANAYSHDSNQFLVFLNEMLGSVSNDVEFVTQSVLDFFFSNQSIDEITYQGALVAFKDNVPENYFDDGSWNTEWGDTVPKQMYMLMLYIIRIPEFQLK